MTDHRRQHALALLATHMAETRIQAEGAAPTEEELALLLEGKLAATRRRQILNHLASNPTLYQQWLSLTALYEKPKISKAPNSLWAVLDRSLNNWLVDWRYAGAGLAAAAGVILLVVNIQPALDRPTSDFALRQPPMEVAERAAIAHREQALRERMENAQRELRDNIMAIEVAPGEECLPVTNGPQAQASHGLLCLERLADEDRTRWFWLAGTEAAARELLLYSDGSAFHAALSGNQQWLAYRNKQDGDAQLHITATASLLAGSAEPTRRFATGEQLSYVWQDNQLIVESSAALGEIDSEAGREMSSQAGSVGSGTDSTAEGETTLRYHYNPVEDQLELQR